MHFITFPQEKLRKIGAILAGHAGYQCSLHVAIMSVVSRTMAVAGSVGFGKSAIALEMGTLLDMAFSLVIRRSWLYDQQQRPGGQTGSYQGEVQNPVTARHLVLVGPV